GVALKKRAERIVGADLLPIHHGRPHELLVDTASISVFRKIALRRNQPLHELRLKLITENALRQLYAAPDKEHTLHDIDAVKLIEEPTAAGVHQHGMALELEQFQCAGHVSGAHGVKRVMGKKIFNIVCRAIVDDAEVIVARGPGVL